MSTLLEALFGGILASVGLSFCAFIFQPIPILVGIWLYRRAGPPFESFVLWLTVKPLLVIPIWNLLLVLGEWATPFAVIPGLFYSLFLLGWYWPQLDISQYQIYLVIILILDGLRWLAAVFALTPWMDTGQLAGASLLLSNLFAIGAFVIVKHRSKVQVS